MIRIGTRGEEPPELDEAGALDCFSPWPLCCCAFFFPAPWLLPGLLWAPVSLAPALVASPVPDCALLFEDPESEDFVDPPLSDAVAPPFPVEECDVVF